MEELTELLDENYGYVEEQSAEKLAEKIIAAGYVKVVRCKDCVHKPHRENGRYYADDPEDFMCPFTVSDDPYLSTDPPDDDFFCASGEERKTKNIERINQR